MERDRGGHLREDRDGVLSPQISIEIRLSRGSPGSVRSSGRDPEETTTRQNPDEHPEEGEEDELASALPPPEEARAEIL